MNLSQTIVALAKRELSIEFTPELPVNLVVISIMEPDGDLLNCLQHTSVTFECAEMAAWDVIEQTVVALAEKVRRSKGWEQL